MVATTLDIDPFPLQCFRTKTLLVIAWLMLVVGSFALSLLGVSCCFFFER